MSRPAAALIGMALIGVDVLAQEPSIATVLARIASYVADYQKQLIGVVAEEHYRQNVITTSRGGRQSRQFRELRSDMLLVKLPVEGGAPGARTLRVGVQEHWLQFRDVFEVDRKPVRDRDERLYNLFVAPAKGVDARHQAEIIQEESSRHYIGPVMRTINLPIMALLFFEESRHAGMQIERLVANKSSRFEPLARAEHVWRLGFIETGTPTMVRGTGGRDVPSHGEIWVDSTTGRILETELVSEDGVQLIATIQVTYGTAPGFTLLLPAQMREVYRVRVNQSRIDSRATYSKFRQFTVTTTEKPKGQ
jgi:hypothetical protein